MQGCEGYLCNAVVLQVDDSGHGHLHAAEHCHHLQFLIIKRWSAKVLNKGGEHVNVQFQVLLNNVWVLHQREDPSLEVQFALYATLTLSSLVPPQKLMPPA